MIREDQYIKAFQEFLREKGYPDLVVRLEFALGNGMRPDIVILDPYRPGFLAVIELKNDESKLEDAHKQVLRYREALGKVRRAAYVAAPSLNPGKRFEIHEVFSDGTHQPITEAAFPSYKSMLLGEAAKTEVVAEETAKNTVDEFKLVSWILAACVLLCLVLDIRKVLVLTTQQLSLAGLAVGLVLAPFAAKFKFLGIEWERFKVESERVQKEIGK